MTKIQIKLLFDILRLVLLFVARQDVALKDKAQSLDREIGEVGEGDQ